MKKKIPLTREEHKLLAEHLLVAQKILEPWIDRFCDAYSVKGKEVNDLKKVMILLSNKICYSQENYWLNLTKDYKSPYFCKNENFYI
ncbi:MAG TPA: hypothetical protein VJY15_13085 [Candidatus Acidoferrum sp.]|nr:hypothetical protein [Candidatus Acidoferrum sp.]